MVTRINYYTLCVALGLLCSANVMAQSWRGGGSTRSYSNRSSSSLSNPSSNSSSSYSSRSTRSTRLDNPRGSNSSKYGNRDRNASSLSTTSSKETKSSFIRTTSREKSSNNRFDKTNMDKKDYSINKGRGGKNGFRASSSDYNKDSGNKRNRDRSYVRSNHYNRKASNENQRYSYVKPQISSNSFRGHSNALPQVTRYSILPIGRRTVSEAAPSLAAARAYDEMKSNQMDVFEAEMLNMAMKQGLPLLTKNDFKVLYPLNTKKRKKQIGKWAEERVVWKEVAGEGIDIQTAQTAAVQQAILQTCGSSGGLQYKRIEEIPNSGRIMKFNIITEDATNGHAYTKLDVCVYVGPAEETN